MLHYTAVKVKPSTSPPLRGLQHYINKPVAVVLYSSTAIVYSIVLYSTAPVDALQYINNTRIVM
jgi:hypothetical protein